MSEVIWAMAATLTPFAVLLVLSANAAAINMGLSSLNNSDPQAKMEVAGQILLAWLDFTLLEQALPNLLLNAVTRTRPDMPILL